MTKKALVGLSAEDHRRLNSWGWQRKSTAKDYERIRQEYVGDERAQRQIDVYGGSEEYHQKLREYRDALRTDDDSTASRLEAWFRAHGYE